MNYTCYKAPKITKLSDFGNNYEEYEKAIYNLFTKDFINNKIYFDGKKVVHKRYPERKGMSGTFWHIVSNKSDEENRLPNLRRYETIEYRAFIIQNCPNNCSNVLIWKNTRRSKTRVLLYCSTLNYLVVLDDRDDYYVFWTSYPVDRNHTHEKLMKEYHSYIARTANQLND